MLLENGSVIKQDVIDSFNRAVANPENHVNPSDSNYDFWKDMKSVNWSFVDADMAVDLCGTYSYDYVYECFDALADEYIGEKT